MRSSRLVAILLATSLPGHSSFNFQSCARRRLETLAVTGRSFGKVKMWFALTPRTNRSRITGHPSSIRYGRVADQLLRIVSHYGLALTDTAGLFELHYLSCG
jgi:hypothetical protein